MVTAVLLGQLITFLMGLGVVFLLPEKPPPPRPACPARPPVYPIPPRACWLTPMSGGAETSLTWSPRIHWPTLLHILFTCSPTSWPFRNFQVSRVPGIKAHRGGAVSRLVFKSEPGGRGCQDIPRGETLGHYDMRGPQLLAHWARARCPLARRTKSSSSQGKEIAGQTILLGCPRPLHSRISRERRQV